MEPNRNAYYRFRETRLNLEPFSSSSSIVIKVPAPPSSRSFRRRSFLAPSEGGRDQESESAFQRKTLSRASSIYRRQHHGSPRSFLWRLLDKNSILSIRAADVTRETTGSEATLVLNFQFVVPIQPNCIALSDPDDHDALCLFVIDEANCVYSFSLRPDLFRRRSSLEPAIADICKVYSSPTLASKSPLRLVALHHNRLLITMNDGGVLRLDRNTGHDAHSFPWRESITNAQSWNQGVLNLFNLRGNSTVKFGKQTLDITSAISAVSSSLGLNSTVNFLFTVSVDHRLRIWNPESGAIICSTDLLKIDHDQQAVRKWLIDPQQTNLVRVVETGVGRGICVTFSPKGPGEFKIWNVVAKDSSTVLVEDCFPTYRFVPLAPSQSDSWAMADFVVSQSESGTFQIWLLWKNNTTYRVMRLDSALQNFEDAWETAWDSVFVDHTPSPPTHEGTVDAAGITEKWLAFILAPGRFTTGTLETALSIYERGVGSSLAKHQDSHGNGSATVAKSSRTLADVLCGAIASSVSLERDASGNELDYEQFQATTDIHWRRFYRLLVELDKQRGDALSLVLDVDADLTWIVCSDYVSAIRDCTSLERICYNSQVADTDRDVSMLLQTAISFYEGLPESITRVCEAALRPELFDEPSRTDLDRVQAFFDKAAFWRGVTEEDCIPITDNLGPNFQKATLDLYQTFFSHLAAAEDTSLLAANAAKLPLSDFGRKLMLRTIVDSNELLWHVCMSQLILLVHMEFEYDQEEDALHHRLDVGTLFREFVAALRRLSLLQWLTKSELAVGIVADSEEKTLVPFKAQNVTASAAIRTVTVLEGYLASRTQLIMLPAIGQSISLSSKLSDVAAELCSPNSSLELSLPLLQCFLLQHRRTDLALDLIPYCDADPLSMYLQGRIHLNMRDFATAAYLLKKASVGMSSASAAHSENISNTILEDFDRTQLFHGLAKYYEHVVNLFAKKHADSYVLEFASLALQFLSSTASKLSAAEVKRLRTDLLSRQFSSSVAISRFASAHSTLLLMGDHALQMNGLRLLVDKMCTAGHTQELTKLPFPGLTTVVDDILTAKCRDTMDVVSGTPYHQILYAWRITHNDYRGAASVLLDRIVKLRRSGEGDGQVSDDVLDTRITRQYLLLINALSCVSPDQAWIFSETLPLPDEKHETKDRTPPKLKSAPQHPQAKRSVVTLVDIRKQYQDELDRITAIQNNQFSFEADDVMDDF